MGHLVIEAIAQAIFEIGGYFTAKLMLPLISLGSVRVGKFQTSAKGSFGPAAVGRRPNGIVEIRSDLASCIGFAIWIVMLIVALRIFR